MLQGHIQLSSAVFPEGTTGHPPSPPVLTGHVSSLAPYLKGTSRPPQAHARHPRPWAALVPPAARRPPPAARRPPPAARRPPRCLPLGH